MSTKQVDKTKSEPVEPSGPDDGRGRREHVSRQQQAEWTPPKRRPDPIKILIASSAGRMEDLLPIRYGRMAISPFTFFRGAAAVMAADLGKLPATGVGAQAWRGV